MTTKTTTAKAKSANTKKTPAAKLDKKLQRTTTRKSAPKNVPQQRPKTQNAPLRENSKLANVIALMRRKEGATIEQLMKATEWQSHSVRGALSGTIKKKLGLKVTSAKSDGVRTYRVVG